MQGGDAPPVASPSATAGAGDPETEQLAAEEKPPAQKPARRKPARALPADWAPSAEHRELAAEHRVDVSAEAVKFRDYGIATGKTYADHDAAFRNWLRRAQPRQNGVQLARGSQPPRKFRDYLSELAARTSESEKLLETTGKAGESEVEK